MNWTAGLQAFCACSCPQHFFWHIFVCARHPLPLKQSFLYADDTGQTRLLQAAAALKLLQSQIPALSPNSQALGRLRPGLPAESGSASAIMGLLSPAPYSNLYQNGSDVTSPDQQDPWLSSAPSPYTIGRMPALAAESHKGGTQVKCPSFYAFVKPE